MFAANNGSWFQQGLNYLKNHPVFISVNRNTCGTNYRPVVDKDGVRQLVAGLSVGWDVFRTAKAIEQCH